MMLVTIMLSLAAGPPATPERGAPCSALEGQLWHDLSVSGMAMNPESAQIRIHERALEALQRCPDSERIAYVSLRAAELGPAEQEPDPAIAKLAEELSARFPRSVKIATVRARVAGSVELARKAVAIDVAYGPAQVALASALLKANDKTAARAAIDAVKDVAAVDGGYAVLARVKWAQADTAGAMDAAQRQLKAARPLLEIEPCSVDVRSRAQAHEILGLVYLKKNQPGKAAPHLLEAESQSKEIRELLRKPDPALRKALARHRRSAGQ
jgi:hypothetical protein